ncbi:MAG: type II secretion system F family protein, partial [Planctomycetota bacterium]
MADPSSPAADSPDALSPGGLSEVIALGEEAAGFAAAGLPLEVGLGSSRPNGLSARVAERLRGGMSLPDAYAAESGPLPAAMRAALESGVRSGRPAEALARVAERSRLIAELRADLGAAMLGPLTVVGAAAALAAWFLPVAAGPLADVLRQAGANVSAPVRFFENLAGVSPLWLALVPAVAIGLTAGLIRLVGGRIFGWLPGLGRVRRELRWSSFAHLLSLLLEAKKPLGESLRLAAESAGRRGRTTLQQAADRLERGEPRSDVFLESDGALPPLLNWTLAKAPPRDLPTAFAEAAEMHGRRARIAAARSTALWPLLGAGLIGGVV